MLEMTDCKHYRYKEIKRSLNTDNIEILKVAYCLIVMSGIDGCQKYCPLYETK